MFRKSYTLQMNRNLFFAGLIFIVVSGCGDTVAKKDAPVLKQDTTNAEVTTKTADTIVTPAPLKISFDTVLYHQKLKELTNGDSSGLWPAKFVYPLPGSVLPFNRIVAFYGNLFSKRMGILGELPKDQMLKKLQQEVDKWKAADSSTPAIPALHYIAVTAQSSPGKGGKHRLRMPFHQIDTIVKWANEIHGLAFLDIQVGGSTVKEETILLERYLKLPNVHFGIDPEFSLKNGETPGTKIGSFNAGDINDAIDILADIVKKNNLPPKVLVVHRFTQGMITDYTRIKKVPEVQVVMNMDGWGDKILKLSTYRRYIHKEPVEFTGFKLFYKNDLKKNKNGLYTAQELLKFKPRPIYIQFQ
jgi:hypothetical protein